MNAVPEIVNVVDLHADPRGHLDNVAPPPQSDVSRLFNVLRRRAGLMAAVVAVAMLLVLVAVFQMTPIYRGDTLVQIETRETNVIDIEAVLSGVATDLNSVRSESQVIKSRQVVGRVVDELGLVENAEFNSRLQPPSMMALIRGRIRGLLGFGQRTGQANAPSAESERAKVVDAVQAAITTEPLRGTRVIQVSAYSRNPEMAAALANQLADTYIKQQLEAKFQATERATVWLRDRLGEMRRRLDESERAVAEFRMTAGLAKAETASVTAEQATRVSSQLIEARAARAEAEARLRQVESLMKSKDGASSIAEVLNSPLIQQLRGQEAEVLRRLSELGTRYGPEHPSMVNIQAEIQDIKAKIETEVRRIVAGLRNEVAVARARERSIATNLDKLEKKLNVLQGSEVKLVALEREAETNRSLYETFLKRFRETSSQQDIQRPDARIVSRADVPSEPAKPRKGLIMMVALWVSVVLALFVVYVLEQLDRGFRSIEQIEQYTGRSTLGLVPHVKNVRGEPSALLLDEPAGLFSEAIRTLQTALLISGGNRPSKVILVTSSVAMEGKTTVAVSLARSLALSGQRVVLLDCDFRRPKLHTAFGVDNKFGLVELLTGAAKFRDTYHLDEGSGAYFITAGSTVPNPADVLNSKQMADFVRLAGDHFDVVVLDSPPLMAVADARVLARLADKTVFVVRWAETRRETVVLALKQLVESGAHVAGLLLSRVDVRKHAQYETGDAGYYYKRHRGYYHYTS